MEKKMLNSVYGKFGESKMVNPLEKFKTSVLNDELKVVEENEVKAEMMLNCVYGKHCGDREDYLKVVEENEGLERNELYYKDYIRGLKQDLKEKIILIEELKENNEVLLNLIKTKNNNIEQQQEEIEKLSYENADIKGLKSKIKELEDKLEKCEEVEETYTLIYGWEDSEGNQKEYKQTGLLREDYEILYGMDSDNWDYHVLVKEVE
jgi:hypothetical protein